MNIKRRDRGGEGLDGKIGSKDQLDEDERMLGWRGLVVRLFDGWDSRSREDVSEWWCPKKTWAKTKRVG